VYQADGVQLYFVFVFVATFVASFVVALFSPGAYPELTEPAMPAGKPSLYAVL